MSFRLAQGGEIDRSRPLAFSFDGKALKGYAGDTLASALLGSGQRLVGRSFKYHRPRGILTSGPEEPNALVELRRGARREPNTPATTIELFEGLEAASQNRFPSLGFDLGAVNGLASPLLVAGFYYKTFMWPESFWERLYEPLIRSAAGLGRASGEPDPDAYEKAFAHCDTLVIGGGPAGLSAALTIGRAGGRAILVDDDFRLGGRLNAERYEIDGAPGSLWARSAAAALAAMPNVRVFQRSIVFGVYDGGVYGMLERVSDHRPAPAPHAPRQRLWRIMARRAVLATGATERPIAFGGNDRPGVMLAGAARAFLNRHAVAAGRNPVIFTNGDDGWRTAADFAESGFPAAAVIDVRGEVAPEIQALARGAPVRLGAQVVATSGAKGLRSALVRASDGRTQTIPTDLLAMSGGYNPQLGLTTHLGGSPRWSDVLSAFTPADLPPGMSVAGSCGGAFTLAGALRAGAAAGAAAARDDGRAVTASAEPRASDEPSASSAFWHVANSRGKAFVDFQNDVTTKDIEIAAREGFRSVEHLKRYTTLGMATDQGKTSNVVGLAILAELTGRSIPETGSTRLRPPHAAVAIGAFAGAHRGKDFRPTRRTAGHAWAAEQGARFIESGEWLRAQWFPHEGETDWLQGVTREVLSVRSGVGICDVSTLGKIALDGPDVGVFLDRVYANTFSTLPVGKARYGIMLREDGFLMDDGTAARLEPDSYVMSTTTANAAAVLRHLEFCQQALWPELDVSLSSVTDQWAQYAIAGPRSRDVLARLLGGALDLSNEAFPFMAAKEFRFGGVTMRLFRISFSGELAYELAAPAHYGDALVRALMEAGRGYAITPYGLEALGIMRIEKGHPAGAELDGRTTAWDLGMDKLMSRKKDYIGRTLAHRAALRESGRPRLVGVRPVDRSARLRAGAHFLGVGQAPEPANDQGHMTSVAYSPTLGHWIGLGLVAHGPDRIGERLRAYDPVRDGDIEVEICDAAFVDPEGLRTHV